MSAAALQQSRTATFTQGGMNGPMMDAQVGDVADEEEEDDLEEELGQEPIPKNGVRVQLEQVDPNHVLDKYIILLNPRHVNATPRLLPPPGQDLSTLMASVQRSAHKKKPPTAPPHDGQGINVPAPPVPTADNPVQQAPFSAGPDAVPPHYGQQPPPAQPASSLLELKQAPTMQPQFAPSQPSQQSQPHPHGHPLHPQVDSNFPSHANQHGSRQASAQGGDVVGGQGWSAAIPDPPRRGGDGQPWAHYHPWSGDGGQTRAQAPSTPGDLHSGQLAQSVRLPEIPPPPDEKWGAVAAASVVPSSAPAPTPVFDLPMTPAVAEPAWEINWQVPPDAASIQWEQPQPAANANFNEPDFQPPCNEPVSELGPSPSSACSNIDPPRDHAGNGAHPVSDGGLNQAGLGPADISVGSGSIGDGGFASNETSSAAPTESSHAPSSNAAVQAPGQNTRTTATSEDSKATTCSDAATCGPPPLPFPPTVAPGAGDVTETKKIPVVVGAGLTEEEKKVGTCETTGLPTRLTYVDDSLTKTVTCLRQHQHIDRDRAFEWNWPSDRVRKLSQAHDTQLQVLIEAVLKHPELVKTDEDLAILKSLVPPNRRTAHDHVFQAIQDRLDRFARARQTHSDQSHTIYHRPAEDDRASHVPTAVDSNAVHSNAVDLTPSATPMAATPVAAPVTTTTTVAQVPTVSSSISAGFSSTASSLLPSSAVAQSDGVEAERKADEKSKVDERVLPASTSPKHNSENMVAAAVPSVAAAIKSSAAAPAAVPTPIIDSLMELTKVLNRVLHPLLDTGQTTASKVTHVPETKTEESKPSAPIKPLSPTKPRSISDTSRPNPKPTRARDAVPTRTGTPETRHKQADADVHVPVAKHADRSGRNGVDNVDDVDEPLPIAGGFLSAGERLTRLLQPRRTKMAPSPRPICPSVWSDYRKRKEAETKKEEEEEQKERERLEEMKRDVEAIRDRLSKHRHRLASAKEEKKPPPPPSSVGTVQYVELLSPRTFSMLTELKAKPNSTVAHDVTHDAIRDAAAAPKKDTEDGKLDDDAHRHRHDRVDVGSDDSVDGVHDAKTDVIGVDCDGVDGLDGRESKRDEARHDDIVDSGQPSLGQKTEYDLFFGGGTPNAAQSDVKEAAGGLELPLAIGIGNAFPGGTTTDFDLGKAWGLSEAKSDVIKSNDDRYMSPAKTEIAQTQTDVSTSGRVDAGVALPTSVPCGTNNNLTDKPNTTDAAASSTVNSCTTSTSSTSSASGTSFASVVSTDASLGASPTSIIALESLHPTMVPTALTDASSGVPLLSNDIRDAFAIPSPQLVVVLQAEPELQRQLPTPADAPNTSQPAVADAPTPASNLVEQRPPPPPADDTAATAHATDTRERKTEQQQPYVQQLHGAATKSIEPPPAGCAHGTEGGAEVAWSAPEAAACASKRDAPKLSGTAERSSQVIGRSGDTAHQCDASVTMSQAQPAAPSAMPIQQDASAHSAERAPNPAPQYDVYSSVGAPPTEHQTDYPMPLPTRRADKLRPRAHIASSRVAVFAANWPRLAGRRSSRGHAKLAPIDELAGAKHDQTHDQLPGHTMYPTYAQNPVPPVPHDQYAGHHDQYHGSLHAQPTPSDSRHEYNAARPPWHAPVGAQEPPAGQGAAREPEPEPEADETASRGSRGSRRSHGSHGSGASRSSQRSAKRGGNGSAAPNRPPGVAVRWPDVHGSGRAPRMVEAPKRSPSIDHKGDDSDDEDPPGLVRAADHPPSVLSRSAAPTAPHGAGGAGDDRWRELENRLRKQDELLEKQNQMMQNLLQQLADGKAAPAPAPGARPPLTADSKGDASKGDAKSESVRQMEQLGRQAAQQVVSNIQASAQQAMQQANGGGGGGNAAPGVLEGQINARAQMLVDEIARSMLTSIERFEQNPQQEMIAYAVRAMQQKLQELSRTAPQPGAGLHQLGVGAEDDPDAIPPHLLPDLQQAQTNEVIQHQREAYLCEREWKRNRSEFVNSHKSSALLLADLVQAVSNLTKPYLQGLGFTNLPGMIEQVIEEPEVKRQLQRAFAMRDDTYVTDPNKYIRTRYLHAVLKDLLHKPVQDVLTTGVNITEAAAHRLTRRPRDEARAEPAPPSANRLRTPMHPDSAHDHKHGGGGGATPQPAAAAAGELPLRPRARRERAAGASSSGASSSSVAADGGAMDEKKKGITTPSGAISAISEAGPMNDTAATPSDSGAAVTPSGAVTPSASDVAAEIDGAALAELELTEEEKARAQASEQQSDGQMASVVHALNRMATRLQKSGEKRSTSAASSAGSLADDDAAFRKREDAMRRQLDALARNTVAREARVAKFAQPA